MKITLKRIGGATFILSLNDLRIACDPALSARGTVHDFFWFRSERIEEPVYSPGDFDGIDLWLVTHNHLDHLDPQGLAQINENSAVVSNRNAAGLLVKQGIKSLAVLDWGETKGFHFREYDIRVTAVPAVHGVNPVSAFFAGRGNGYFLEISTGGERVGVYITGDTVYKRRFRKIFRDRKTDILIPNMGAAKQGSWIMTLTLNAKMLWKLMNDVDPALVVPVHYGTFEHYIEPVTEIVAFNDQRIKFVAPGETLCIQRPA